MAVSTVTPLTKETAPSPGGAVPEAGVSKDLKAIEPAREPAVENAQASPSSVDEVKEIAEALNEYMDDLKTDLGFSVHEELNHQVIVEIKNKDTNELVKQIPSEELMAIKEKMAELTGLLFDRNV